MGLMIKYSIKNIFAKPFRLILLVICISFASLTALLAVDMRNNIASLMQGYLLDMLGKMDIMVYNSSPEVMEGADGIAAMKKVGVSQVMQFEYDTDPSGYLYSYETPVTVMTVSDYPAAYEMAFFPKEIAPDDSSAVINQSYADTFGVGIGDTIHLQTRDEVDIELVVCDILEVRNILASGETIFVSNGIVKRIACLKDFDYDAWMIDVEEDAKVSEVADALRQADPAAELEVLQEEMEDPDMQQMYNLFYLLFLISFLLVIFVTVSMAEKIVNERMAVIGTLRSLGISRAKTTVFLLLENIIYAVIGTGIGCFLYSKVKPAILSSMINLSVEGKDPKQYIGATPLWVYVLVLAAAILVECAYPLYELTKAVKTPIRDIIFENKDTAFRYRFGRLYAGIVLAVIALVSGLLVKNFVTLAVSLVSGIIALAVLIPFLIRIFSNGITALCRKLSFPVAQLAAENVSRNKIIMGTAVLCVTSLTLSLLIAALGEALAQEMDLSACDYDVVVDINVNDDYHDYRYLARVEGVEESDLIYRSAAMIRLGEEAQKIFTVLADTPHSLYAGLSQDGYDLKENEIVLSTAAVERLGLRIGDEIDLVLYPDTDFPIEKRVIIKDAVNMEKIQDLGIWSVIISKDMYDRFFSGNLGRVMLRCEDAAAVKERIEKCSESSALEVHTREEMIADERSESGGLRLVIRLVVSGSAALTLIGIAGNQALGFLSRKRENALLYSVALPRNSLKKMIFLESLFSMGISAIVALIAAPFIYSVLGHLLDVIADGELNILGEGSADIGISLAYLAVILAVYLLTVLIPCRYLQKMNIAEELKYE